LGEGERPLKDHLDIFSKREERGKRGAPNRQADFIYYMVWILFTAFLVMFVSNLYRLIIYLNIDYAIWAAVGFAITSIQYFSLKGMYDMKKMRKQATIKSSEVKLDSVDDMMKDFHDEKNTSTIKGKSELQSEE